MRVSTIKLSLSSWPKMFYHGLMNNIFHDYDIRGIYPQEINEDLAFKIGNAMAVYLKAGQIIVGEDVRESSLSLGRAVIDGIISAGSDVIYIGQCTTPLFYFATTHLKAGGGAMITASHNPKNYNGFKIVNSSGEPIGYDGGLKDLEFLIKQESVVSLSRGKILERSSIIEEYINFLIDKSGLAVGEFQQNIVADAGNGSVALILKSLFDRLEIKYKSLFFEIDSQFSGRGPDPIKGDAMKALKEEVQKTGAVLGFAFDGDADRVSFVDESGNTLDPQHILAILWQGEGANRPVIYESRFSKAVIELFGAYGIRSKVGHTNISKIVRENSAQIAGETSGHFFFKDMDSNESAILAALKIIKYVQQSGLLLSEIVKPFRKYYYSGETTIRSSLGTDNIKLVLAKLKERYKDGEIDEFDGLTVEYWTNRPIGSRWWFNVRPSNTEPVIRLVVESDSEILLEEKEREVEEEIKNTETNR